MKLRSEVNRTGADNGLCRSLYKAMGYSDEELTDRPVIGIANSWSTLVPGHYNLRLLADFVRKGIYRAGGTAVEFGTISCCDGIANGHEGMKYILPAREVVCDSVEIAAQAHRLDALVLLASCDKILPGMLMAAARLDIPAIIVTGGVMEGGGLFDGRKSDATSNDEAAGMYHAGRISAKELRELEDVSCPGCGSCSFLGTANTMACVTEALGMSLPGSALIPAVWADRQRCAYESGIRICQLAEQGITPRQIIDQRAVRNAVRVVQAVSGSTNAVLHLSAIAYEAGLSLNVVNLFDSLYQTTPHLVKVNPSAAYDMEDFHRAGGIPRLMERLGDLIDRSALTCTGRPLGENLAQYVFITATALENKTMPRLLELTRNCCTVIWGPSTPLTETLLDAGADALLGNVVLDPEQVGRIAGEGGFFQDFRAYTRSVLWFRDAQLAKRLQ